jgi:hypothetical protein
MTTTTGLTKCPNPRRYFDIWRFSLSIQFAQDYWASTDGSGNISRQFLSIHTVTNKENTVTFLAIIIHKLHFGITFI